MSKQQLTTDAGKFLSTLSLRRATCRNTLRLRSRPDFYPRSPCGERHFSPNLCWCLSYFYPRSPCGERRERPSNSSQQVSFLSTLSLRRATAWHPIKPTFLANFYPRSPCGERQVYLALKPQMIEISIHALLAESDERCRCWVLSDINFYPRSPCGERPPQGCFHFLGGVFLSTLSLRRATWLTPT